MSFEVFVLGTSGMMPIPGRFLTSAMLRRNGELFLFDCGEGTQVSLKMLNLHWKKISRIFITHMHADHVTGLPGLLMLSAQVDRDEPLYIYGPPRLQEYIEENRRILDMYINYPIIIKTISSGVFLETEDYTVEALPLLHTKPCFGFVFKEKDRKGEFFPDKAKSLGVPMGKLWGQLQNGNSVTLEDGTVVVPSQVMGNPRQGRKFSYITDTMYLDYISESVQNSDLLLCEGMFANDLLMDAREKKHMLSSQAAMIGLKGNVEKLGLIHYSPRYSDRELKILKEEACEIFPRTILCKDRMSFDIPLKD
ncbi:MAG: ribonuclease Z [Sphaerochaetaceae bacterium]|jgi:ribonuclease Z|nr:ribonuclease Z [Sphaerochaetaceae bacterium]NLY07802.1 ribonuclease Z [Spirochaetales bacterium]